MNGEDRRAHEDFGDAPAPEEPRAERPDAAEPAIGPAEERVQDGPGTAPEPGRDPAAAAAPGPASGDGPPSAADEDGPGGPEAEPEPEPWHRLSPLTLLTAPMGYLRSFAVPLLIALVAGTFNLNPWVLGSTLVAIIATLIAGVITYKTFRYQVGTDRLEIRRGLISRSRRSIPLQRIRGVDVTAQPLHRMLGLAVVKIEAASGGGESEEGKLDAVTAAEAERLRTVLLHRRAVLRGDSADGATEGAGPAGAPQVAAGAGVAPTVYFVMPPSWYFYAVLSLGYLLTPFVALAALLGFGGQAIDVSPGTEGGDAAHLTYLWLRDVGVTVLLLLAVLLLAVLVLMMPVAAVISYAITYWRFTLLRRDSSLVAERGLLTRQSVTLEHRRIRGYELLDNPLQRLRDAVKLRAIVTGLGETATRAVLLPIGDRTRVLQVVERALDPFRGTLIGHPRAALGRRLFRAVMPFALAAAVAWALDMPWVAGLFTLLALAGVPLGIDRYRSLGHGYDGRLVSVRSGSISREQAVVQRAAVIGWTWRQSVFQRWSGLADLDATVGAGDGACTAIDAGFDESVLFAAGVTPEMVEPFLRRPGGADGRAKGPKDRPADGAGSAGDGQAPDRGPAGSA
ncbi:putative membrane protein [Nocardiopsis mwathae]|uniref:Putative membrane protein n=1 Tax=Nocardiopsis mwathae TaxID=1472723 RepID=A0A7W9YFN7_9ACTN|nr:putative membrane protein [Nocardiopsis mwathae]